MANIKITTEEQRRHEAQVMSSFGINPQHATKEQREYAQEISRRTAEIERGLHR